MSLTLVHARYQLLETLRIPIAERAKPRKISIGTGEDAPKQIDA